MPTNSTELNPDMAGKYTTRRVLGVVALEGENAISGSGVTLWTSDAKLPLLAGLTISSKFQGDLLMAIFVIVEAPSQYMSLTYLNFHVAIFVDFSPSCSSISHFTSLPSCLKAFHGR